MDSLLQFAYVEQRCNVCGGSYPITLLDALSDYRLRQEWRSPRPCIACEQASSAFAASMPGPLLEQLDAAWRAVQQAAGSAGFPLAVGEPDPGHHAE